MKRLAMLLVVVVGCGSDNPNPGQADASIDSPVDSGGGIGDSMRLFTLTSPMLTEGAAIAMANTCDGANTSPQLDWTGNAMNAMSYAIVFTDKSNNLIHWVIYDIPASATGLPANVMKAYAPTNVPGAHQTLSFGTSGTRGYLGPCPPMQDGAHIYEFAVYGVNAPTLPGAMMSTNRDQAAQIIMQNMTARTTLTGMYDR